MDFYMSKERYTNQNSTIDLNCNIYKNCAHNPSRNINKKHTQNLNIYQNYKINF
jgi:hypothetical protein